MRTKLILVLVLMLGFIANAYAQFDLSPAPEAHREAPVAFRLGVTAGANMSGLKSSSSDVSNYPSSGIRFGFNAGALFNLRFLPRNELSTAAEGLLAIQPEVRFSMMGGKDNPGIGLSYVTVPLMIQFYPLKNLYVEVGPVAAFNIAHTPNITVVNKNEYHLEKLKANDVMLAAGLGYMFRGLGVGVRFNYGLSDIAANMPWKNWCLQAGVSYSFQLGAKKQAADTFNF